MEWTSSLGHKITEMNQRYHVGFYEYLEVLAILLYLKYLGEEESELFPKQAQRYRWKNWIGRPYGGQMEFVEDEVLPYMGSLQANEIAVFFQGATLNTIPLHIYEETIKLLEPFDTQSSKDQEQLLLMFRYFANLYGLSYYSEHDPYYITTPSHIEKFMVQLLNPQTNESVYDPACSTGGFLSYSMTYSEHQPVLAGMDSSRRMTRIAGVHLLLSGANATQVKRGDSLLQEFDESYDVVLTKLPFSAVSRIPDDKIDFNSRLDLQILDLVMKTVSPAGRCAVLTHNQVLSSTNKTFVQLRKRLLLEHQVLAVISLPDDLFIPWREMGTSILVFSGKKHTDKLNQVCFFEVKNDGFETIDIDSPRQVGGSNEIPLVLNAFEKYKKSKYQTPPGIAHHKLISKNQKIEGWYVPQSQLLENDALLWGELYRPTEFSNNLRQDPRVMMADLVKGQQKIVEQMLSLEQMIRKVLQQD